MLCRYKPRNDNEIEVSAYYKTFVKNIMTVRIWGNPRTTSNLNCLFLISLRADEIKLWLTPFPEQRRNPCCGLQAVYPDLSTRHDWPVKKGLCFVCRDRQSGWREIQNALTVIRWVRLGSRTCLVPIRHLSRPCRSMHFGDVSETNSRETPRQSWSAHAWAFLKSSHGQLK